MSHVECPTREQLADYLLGTLDEPVADWVMGHLEKCATCDEKIDKMEDVSDPIIDGLREPAADDDSWGEPAYQRLISALGQLNIAALDVGVATVAAAPPRVIEQLDEYRLLEKLGEGGMGAVYRALHTKLDRVVAVKVLSHKRMSRSDAVSRFEREMKAVGKLNHPNIVHAYDAGEDDETHYLVMEFVRGIDLRRLVKELGPLPVAEACEIMRQAASGLDHAYRHGLVHRDIKPSNLMLTHSGRVKILDLGLALLQDQHADESDLTTEGQLMGTIEYMAPEQGDNSHVVDTRADIYSLGATLYKLLAGRAPFSGKKYSSAVKKMRALVHDPVPSIQEKRPDVSDGLANVLHTMLAKSPEDRYARPRDVAELLATHAEGADLVGLLQSRSAASVVAEMGAKAETETATNTPAAAISTDLASQCESAPRPSAPRQTAPRQTSPRQTAPRQTAPRQTAPRQTAPRQTAPRQTAPRQTASQGAVASVKERADKEQSWARAPGTFGLVFLWTVLFFVTAVSTLAIVSGRQIRDRLMQWSRSGAGETVAGDMVAGDMVAGDGGLASSDSEGDTLAGQDESSATFEGFTLWGAQDAAPSGVLRDNDSGLPDDYLLDEPSQAAEMNERNAWLRWKTATGAGSLPRPVWSQAVERDISGLRLSDPRDLLIATSPDDYWYAWDIPSGMEFRPVEALPGELANLRISPAGDVVVGCGQHASLTILQRISPGAFELIADPLGGKPEVDCLDVSSQGVLAMGSGDGVLRVMPPDGSPPRQLYRADRPIQSVSWNNSGNSLVAPCAAPSQDFTPYFLIWHSSREKAIAFESHEPLSTSQIDLSSSGRLLATLASSRNKIIVWDTNGKLVQSLSVPAGHATALCFVPGSGAIIYGTDAGDLYLVDARSGKGMGRLASAHQSSIRGLTASRNGLRLVSSDAQSQIGIWNLSEGPPGLAVTGQAEQLTAMTISHDGTLLAAAGSDDASGSIVRIGLWLLPTDDALWNIQ